jgi:RNA polymerase sigma-70 factor (ECF subfamily)
MTDIHQEIEAKIPQLRRYARALVRDAATADDLVQDCLARALARTHLWQEGTNLRAWLFTILHNQYVNQVRRTAREGITIDISDAEQLLAVEPIQDRQLDLRDFDRALAKLPEKQRVPILLVGLEGMDYRATAALLGIPVGTVRSRISRGRDALRALIGAGVDQQGDRSTPQISAWTARRRPRSVTTYPSARSA